MDERERELLDAMVNRVLRHPDEVKDIDAQRAVLQGIGARDHRALDVAGDRASRGKLAAKRGP